MTVADRGEGAGTDGIVHRYVDSVLGLLGLREIRHSKIGARGASHA